MLKFLFKLITNIIMAIVGIIFFATYFATVWLDSHNEKTDMINIVDIKDKHR